MADVKWRMWIGVRHIGDTPGYKGGTKGLPMLRQIALTCSSHFKQIKGAASSHIRQARRPMCIGDTKMHRSGGAARAP